MHGITDEDVRESLAFCQILCKLIRFLNGADLAGFNVKKFDLPLLLAEFERCGRSLPLAGRRVIDVMEIYHARERRDLTSAVRLYCGREHSHAHAALGDVLATTEVLDAQQQLVRDGFSTGGRAPYDFGRFLVRASDGEMVRPLEDGKRTRKAGCHVRFLPTDSEKLTHCSGCWR